MSLSASSLRRHALAHIRRQVSSGQFTKKDVTRWEKEFADDPVGARKLQEILDAGPSPASSTKSSSSTSSKE